ncbi:hypothetical protein ACFSR6_04785 [Pedobacter vanadiisoli]|uniref:DUF4760 domain-containing protein n=1 Tax=Pedobacter vanadiisoli TaxID=1761975 RepID=A0ABW5MF12_9SPHI
MRNKTNPLTTILSCLVLGTICYLGYFLIIRLKDYLKLIDPNIIVAVIAGLVTVTGYFLTRNFERKKIIEQQIREKKLPVYEEFISFLFNVLMASKLEQPISNIEMEKFMVDFNKKSIVWLSDKSLKAYVKWKESAAIASDDKESSIANLFILEELLLEFRKDIGHENKDFKKGDLLKLFVNDLDNHL